MSRRRLRVHAALAAFVAAATCLVAVPSTPQAGASTEGYRLVGQLPIAQSASVIYDESQRRLLALEDTRIDAYDARSLQKTATTNLAPYRMFAGTSANYAFAGSKLYVLVYAPLPGGTADSNRSTPLLATVHAESLAVESVRPFTSPLFPAGVAPKGMSYYAPEHKLYVVGQSPAPLAGDYSVALQEVDVARAAPWTTPYSLGSTCGKLISSRWQAAVHRLTGTPRVYLGCGTGDLTLARQPGLPGIARVDIGNLTTTRFTLSGTYGAGDSLVDPATGRLVLISAGVAFPYQAAWIFDETREVVVGIVNAGSRDIQSTGMDPVNGRIFVSLKTMEVLSTTYLGRRLPQATADPLPPLLVGGTIISFGSLNRIAIPRQVAGAAPGQQVTSFYVYEHSLPPYAPPLEADPDASTVDLPEAQGKTEAVYGADAKAFGARIHQVAGVNGTLQQISTGEFWSATGGRSGLNDGDRDMQFSRIHGARLAPSEASASAVTTEGDANTRGDHALLTKERWPYTATTCTDFGGKPTAATAPDGTASTTCDASAGRVDVSAYHEDSRTVTSLESGSPLVSFGYSTSSVKLFRHPKEGLVVETKAEARDVVFGGVIRVGKIVSTARSAAKGRPGTAKASYSRHVEDVTINGQPCPQCDLQTLVDQVNNLVPQLQAEAPKFELTQTPRGAVASALRDPWEHEQDLLLNNEGETTLEIPALRISYVHDNTSRSRILFEFAATMANSAYSIYQVGSLGDDEAFGDVFDLDPALEEFFAGSGGVGAEEFYDEFAVGQLAADVGFGVGSGDGDGDGDGDGLGTGTANGASFGRRLGEGIRLLFTGRRALLLNALLWSLLLFPTFLVGRRRYLLRVIGDSS